MAEVTPKEIRASRKAIEKECRVAKAQLRACEARLDALQAYCEHRAMKVETSSGSYGGPDFESTQYRCPDCGYLGKMDPR